MISQDYYSTYVEDSLLQKIEIKENQLRIAKESCMVYVAEALEIQLLELRSQLPKQQDQELEALMSLLDD